MMTDREAELLGRVWDHWLGLSRFKRWLVCRACPGLVPVLDDITKTTTESLRSDYAAIRDGAQPAGPTMNLLIDERTGKTRTTLGHLPTPALKSMDGRAQ